MRQGGEARAGEWRGWVLAVLLVAGAVVMAPHGNLDQYGTVPWFLLGAAWMGGGLGMALGWWEKQGGSGPGGAAFWAGAVGARLVLLGQVPGGDIYRYVWEGRVLAAGWNPYVHGPESVVLEGLRDGLWAEVQHKAFTAIYPPLAEWVFALLAVMGAGVGVFKVVFAAADLGVAKLLEQRLGAGRALVWAWNPLVIYVFAGGGHYDALFVLAMVVGWWVWEDGREAGAAMWLGVAVALKWMALPLLGWAVWRMWRERGWGAAAGGAVAGVLPLTAAYGAVGMWTGEWTMQLHPPQFSNYARSAELIPALVGGVWEASRYGNGWVLVPLAAGWLVGVVRGRDFARTAEGLIFWVLVLTPMLHAWYLTWMIPFAAATRNPAGVAAGVCGFVYFLLHHHQAGAGGGWQLRPWELALLWGPLVGGFVWSWWKRRAGI